MAIAAMWEVFKIWEVICLFSGGDTLVELITLWARKEVSMSGLLWCRGGIVWATMLVSKSGLL